MKCRDAKELINAYLDNGIDPMKDRLLSEHMQQCDKCRGELEFLINLKMELKNIRPVKAPPLFMSKLRKRIEDDTAGMYRRFFSALHSTFTGFRFPFEAAALLVVASILFTLYRPDRILLHRAPFRADEKTETLSYDRTGQGDVQKTHRREGKEKFINNDSAYNDLLKEEKKKVPDTEWSGTANEIRKDDSAAEDSQRISMKDEMSEKETAEGSETDKAFYKLKKTEKSIYSSDSEVLPDRVINKYGAKIITMERKDDGSVIYTVMVDEGKSGDLAAELKTKFNAEIKSVPVKKGKTRLTISIKNKK